MDKNNNGGLNVGGGMGRAGQGRVKWGKNRDNYN